MQKQALYQPSADDQARYAEILKGALAQVFAKEAGRWPKGSKLQARLLTAQVAGPGQFSAFALTYEIVDESGRPI